MKNMCVGTYKEAARTIPLLVAIACNLGWLLGAGMRFLHRFPPLGRQRIHKCQGWIRSCTSEPGTWRGMGLGGREKGASIDLLPSGLALSLYLCDCRLHAYHSCPCRGILSRKQRPGRLLNLIASTSRMGLRVWLRNPGAGGQDSPGPESALGPCTVPISLLTGAHWVIWAARAQPWWDVPRSTVDLPWTSPARKGPSLGLILWGL